MGAGWLMAAVITAAVNGSLPWSSWDAIRGDQAMGRVSVDMQEKPCGDQTATRVVIETADKPDAAWIIWTLDLSKGGQVPFVAGYVDGGYPEEILIGVTDGGALTVEQTKPFDQNAHESVCALLVPVEKSS